MSASTGISKKAEFETQVSAYDRVSSMLAALVILCGIIAAILFVMWWVRRISFEKEQAEVLPAFELTSPGELAEGVANDFEEPGVEELPDVAEPQLADAVEALTDAVSTVQARFADVEGTAELMGSGTGLGDVRGTGPGGGNMTGRNEAERWRFNYVTTGIENYARQLEHFHIELASAPESLPSIDYTFNLTKPNPDSRSGLKNDDSRIAFHSSKTSETGVYDVELLRRAGVPTGGERRVFHVIPDELRARLLSLERESLKREGRELDQVLSTHFGVRDTGSGYEFFVQRHDYL